MTSSTEVGAAALRVAPSGSAGRSRAPVRGAVKSGTGVDSLPARLRALPVGMLREMVVPLAVLGIVVALITPLPAFVLDLLIVSDILLSVTVLMVSLYLVRPVDFTSYPTTLLLLTLFRLALNVSS